MYEKYNGVLRTFSSPLERARDSSEPYLQARAADDEEVVPLSAETGFNMEALEARVAQILTRSATTREFVLPTSAGSVQADMKATVADTWLVPSPPRPDRAPRPPPSPPRAG